MTTDEIEQLYRVPPESERASVCVHRDDVMTVSLTRIEVGARQVSLAYTAGQPCRTAAGPSIMLDRVSSREASAPYLGNIGANRTMPGT